MPTIWRLHLKSGARGVDPGEFCIEKGILGVGWPVKPDKNNLDWKTYSSRGTKQYYDEDDKGWWPALNSLKNSVKVGDLCWTRTEKSKYWLGKIAGEWEYRNGPEYKSADIVNVRAAELHEVGNLQEVPGRVLNSFIRRRTLQRIHDEGIGVYSVFLFNSISGRSEFKLPLRDVDLFALLSPSECEDVVGVYLQDQGCVLFPSTCKTDTKDFEFVLRGKDGSHVAVQVKQGDESIHRDAAVYSAFEGEVVLFQTRDLYEGHARRNVRCLETADMKRFTLEHLNLMPPNIQRWVKIWKMLTGQHALRRAAARG